MEVEEIRVRERPAIAPAIVDDPFRLLLDVQQRSWIGERQRREEHAVDHGEHHRRGARSEREREQRDRREGGAAPQIAERVADVLPQIVEPPRAARVAAALFHLLGPAERQPRQAARLLGRHPARDEIRRVRVEMEPQLALEQLLHPAAPQHALPPGHSAPASDMRRITATASLSRRQLAVSACSADLPLRVSR